MSVMVTMTLDEYNENLRLQRMLGKGEGVRTAYDELAPILTEIEYITNWSDKTAEFCVGFDGITDEYRWHLRQLMIKSGY